MVKIFNNIKSTFFKNTFALLTGATITQLIPLITAPILSRIYLPEYYGYIGLYISFSTIATSITNLQLSQAIIVTETKEEEDNLVLLCLLLTILFTFISLIIVFFYNHFNLNQKVHNSLNLWLWFLPLSILINGMSTIYIKLLTKHNKFRLLSFSRVSTTIITVSISLFVGYLTKTELGLFLGLLIGQFTGLFIIMVGSKELALNIHSCKKEKMIGLIKKHKKFTLFTLPSDFLGNWSSQLPIQMITYYSTANAVGLFNYTQRMVSIPINLISGSTAPVFAQRATKDYLNDGCCRPIYIKTSLMLAGIGFLPFLGLLLFAPNLFGLVFGEKWIEAGIYAQILTPMFYLKFIVNPLSFVFYLANKQFEDFILNIFTIVLIFLSLYLGHYFFNNVYWMLVFFSFSFSLIYLIYLIRGYQLTIKP